MLNGVGILDNLVAIVDRKPLDVVVDNVGKLWLTQDSTGNWINQVAIIHLSYPRAL